MANLDKQTYKSSWNPNVAEMVINITDDNGQGAAGVYTASVTIPEGSYINDIIVQAVTTWDSATSCNLLLGDEDDPNGYLENTNLKSGGLESPLASAILAESGAGLGAAGVYIMDADGTGGGIYKAGTRTVTAQITTGGAGTVGETRVVVSWSTPTDVVKGNYVAS